MVDLYNEGCAALVAEQFGDQNNFTAGKALFYVGSSSGLPFIRSGVEEAFAEPFDWSMTFVPYSDAPVQNVYGASVSIPATTPEAQLAAWLFIRWFSEPEQQAKWAEISNYFPVRFSAQDGMQAAFADFPQYGAAWDLIQGETKVEPQIASYDAIRNEAKATFDTLLSSGGDVETALTDLTNAANEIMATFEVAPQ
jgi:ABC-type glycerol-3-phosphate transport system substrate-binding protein